MMNLSLLQFGRLELGDGYSIVPYEYLDKLSCDIVHHKNGATLVSYGLALTSHQHKPITSLLEIGVQNGGSLCLWHKVFPECSIAGIDVTFGQLQSEFHGWNCPNKVRLLMANCRNKDEIVRAAISVQRPLGMVIDDGAHDIVTISNCFSVLWPELMVGGLYFVEDYAALHSTHYEALVDMLRSYKDAALAVYPNFLFLEKI